jgi:SrtB family sortase
LSEWEEAAAFARQNGDFMKEDKTNQKKKNSKGIKTLLIIIMVVAVCVLAFSAYKLISIKKSYEDTANYYNEVADLLTAPIDSSDEDAAEEEPDSEAADAGDDTTAADKQDTATADDKEGTANADANDGEAAENTTAGGTDAAGDAGTEAASNEAGGENAADNAGADAADTEQNTSAGGAGAADNTGAADTAEAVETTAGDDTTDQAGAAAGEDAETAAEGADSEDADNNTTSSHQKEEIVITNVPENRNNSILNYDMIHYKSINFNFKALLKLCEDGIGYIYQDDTVISYPILQAEDNDKYLRSLMNGEYNVAGSLFVDYAFKEGLNGRYSIIYGHNMDDGSMFGTITQYKNEEYYKEHPEFQIFVGDRGYVYYVYAAAQVPIDSFVFDYNDMTDEEFLDFMAQIKELTDYDIEIPVKITEHSHVVLLSTCIEYPRDYNYRYITVLVRGEKLWDKPAAEEE